MTKPHRTDRGSNARRNDHQNIKESPMHKTQINSAPDCTAWTLRLRLSITASCLALCWAMFSPQAVVAQDALSAPSQPPLRDQRIELALKIRAPFTVVAVGDMLHTIPISKMDDPNVQYLMNVLRSADMTVADNENTIVDHDTFSGPISHMEAPPSVADDWANMGIKAVTKANNHTWDNGDEGIWQDFRELDRVGIIHVGVDKTTAEARLARYVPTPKGIVGVVGVYADNGRQIYGLPLSGTITVTPDQLTQLRRMRDSIVARRSEVGNPIALPPTDAEATTSVFGLTFKAGAPGATDADATALAKRVKSVLDRHGVISTKMNVLNLTTYYGVTASQMAQLRAIAGDKGTGDKLSAWNVNFKIAPGPGEYSYDMDRQDERDILREIRTGKQDSDLEVATIHWHQNRFAYQHYSFDHYPADFEISFAHDAIDQGADVFVGHGVHTIKGVEIYKGKPIFYGVSNFVLMEQRFLSWRDTGAHPQTPPAGPIVGEAEENERHWGWMELPDNYEALVASSHFENGKLTEVRIYPVDLGRDRGGLSRPGSQLGVPKRPSPEMARDILTRVAEYSKPFGTKIEIEDGVGVIRIPH
jgi:poly-gamma-glutamate capsule biosynthesis protein CapA/YwtB (metallophosphatase superfamily)